MKVRVLWLAMAGVFLIVVAYLMTALPAGPTRSQGITGPPSPSPTVHGDGLSDSHDGYRMVPVTLPEGRGAVTPVAFRILGPSGQPTTEYETVQAKPLHLYLIRDDFSGYQHLHPELAGDAWTTTVNIPDGGAYRLFAEFTPKGRGDLTGHPTVLGLPFVVPGDTAPVALPAPAASAGVDGYTVTRLDGTAHLSAGKAALLRFRVTGAGGGPVTNLEPYLGAYAHMSAFEVFTQALSHMHPAVRAGAATGAPADGTLIFHAQFPNRGEQRMFLQFQVEGKVREVAFTVFVT